MQSKQKKMNAYLQTAYLPKITALAAPLKKIMAITAKPVTAIFCGLTQFFQKIWIIGLASVSEKEE